MVSILPGPRTAWGAIGAQLGQNLNQVMPGVIQQRQQRERGYQAIDRLQQELASANGDMSKILPAIARAYTDNPNLQRSGIAEHAIKIGMAKMQQLQEINHKLNLNREIENLNNLHINHNN